MKTIHIPVLKKEVLEYLDPRPNENFIDCTIGGGGHALAILEKTKPQGRLLGIDRDPEIISALDLKFKIKDLRRRLVLVCDNFGNLESIVEKYNFRPVHGILFDFGVSGWHLEESGRGFSFLRDEPLIMRYQVQKVRPPENILEVELSGRNPTPPNLTAADIVNNWPPAEIERILREYGEEKFASKIVRQIIKEREIKPIKTTLQLVGIIKKAVPIRYRRGRIHFATRTFQALRIAVNGELDNIKTALPQAAKILESGGRMACISFHSLEDRTIKNFFREEEKNGRLKTLTKKPITPSVEELRQNPRSRSAKLRAAEILKS